MKDRLNRISWEWGAFATLYRSGKSPRELNYQEISFRSPNRYVAGFYIFSNNLRYLQEWRSHFFAFVTAFFSLFAPIFFLNFNQFMKKKFERRPNTQSCMKQNISPWIELKNFYHYRHIGFHVWLRTFTQHSVGFPALIPQKTRAMVQFRTKLTLRPKF